MQQREFLIKLTQARQAQNLVLQRFAHAQERLALLEQRQQSLHIRLHGSTPAPEHDESGPNVAFLPENGELELQATFTPLPQTDQEQTERIVTRPTEAAQ
jgi:hypothetical protein